MQNERQKQNNLFPDAVLDGVYRLVGKLQTKKGNTETFANGLYQLFAPSIQAKGIQPDQFFQFLTGLPPAELQSLYLEAAGFQLKDVELHLNQIYTRFVESMLSVAPLPAAPQVEQAPDPAVVTNLRGANNNKFLDILDGAA
jgi:hypothetical protein